MFKITKNPLLQSIIDKYSEELLAKYPLQNRINEQSNVESTFFNFGTYNDVKNNIQLYKSISEN